MPARQQAEFYNPANGDTYSWPLNPPFNGETAAQKLRQIERTANTGIVGATKQVGDDGPYILDWKVNVFTEAFERALWTWWQICKTQTIYLTDWNGEAYEGQIIELTRQRVGALAGPGDTNARGFYCVYEMQYEVWSFISGVLAAAGVQP
jgi:hypothetical protein